MQLVRMASEDTLNMMIEDKVTSLKEELEELIEEVKNEVDDGGANLPQIESCRVSRSINWTNPWTNLEKSSNNSVKAYHYNVYSYR